MNLGKIYLVLAIIGFVAPNLLVAIESVESGNILLYAHPLATMEAMFTNRISTIFMIDLLFAVLVFFIWSFHEAKRLHIKNIGWIWLATLVLGLAGAFPLFLYLREEKNQN